jgi:hypothetical protein
MKRKREDKEENSSKCFKTNIQHKVLGARKNVSEELKMKDDDVVDLLKRIKGVTFVKLPQFDFDVYIERVTREGPGASRSNNLFVSTQYKQALESKVSTFESSLLEMVVKGGPGQSRWILVSGPGGVGKSHFLYFLASLAFANHRPVIYFPKCEDFLSNPNRIIDEDKVAYEFLKKLKWFTKDIQSVQKSIDNIEHDEILNRGPLELQNDIRERPYSVLERLVSEEGIQPLILVDQFNDVFMDPKEEWKLRSVCLRKVMNMFRDVIVCGTSRCLFRIEEASGDITKEVDTSHPIYLNPLSAVECKMFAQELESCAFIPRNMFSLDELEYFTGFVPRWMNKLAVEVHLHNQDREGALRKYKEDVKTFVFRRERTFLKEVLDPDDKYSHLANLAFHFASRRHDRFERFEVTGERDLIDLSLFKKNPDYPGTYHFLCRLFELTMKRHVYAEWVKDVKFLDQIDNKSARGVKFEKYLIKIFSKSRVGFYDHKIVNAVRGGTEIAVMSEVPKLADTLFRYMAVRTKSSLHVINKSKSVFLVDDVCPVNQCYLYSTEHVSNFKRIDFVIADRRDNPTEDTIYFVQATVSSFKRHSKVSAQEPFGEFGEFMENGLGAGLRSGEEYDLGIDDPSDMIGILNAVYGLKGDKTFTATLKSVKSRRGHTCFEVNAYHPDCRDATDCYFVYMGVSDSKGLPEVPFVDVLCVDMNQCRKKLGVPFSKDDMYICDVFKRI